MSDTPEIDSLRSEIINLQDQRDFAMKVIKRLEEERDEAREKYDTLAVENMLEVHKLCKERDDALMDRSNGDIATMTINYYERILKELNEAKAERDEAQKQLSSIHRWIERNHSDGFIDSLTYLQNLERVTDSWHDRLDKMERDKNEV
jgi:vacuolar-type H+-ATPase subunit I/STV1